MLESFFSPIASRSTICKLRVAGDVSVVRNPSTLSVFPFAFLDLFKKYEFRFSTSIQKTLDPIVLSSLWFKRRWVHVRLASAFWIVGFANVAHKFRDWVYEAVYVGSDKMVLRLFGRMFAHTLSPSLSVKETVQWMAALNNYTRLEAL
jgi:hypothetical protein